MTSEATIRKVMRQVGCDRRTAAHLVEALAHRDILEPIARQAGTVARKYRSDANGIDQRWDLAAEQKTAGRKIARDEAEQKLADLKLLFNRVRPEAEAAAAKAVFAADRDVDTATQLRRNTAWDRARQRLDDGAAVREVIDDATRLADLDTLAALRQEAPAWYSATYGGDHLPATYMDDLTATAPPAVQAAHALQQEIRTGNLNTEGALGGHRRNLDSGGAVGVLVWDGTSDIDLARFNPREQQNLAALQQRSVAKQQTANHSIAL